MFMLPAMGGAIVFKPGKSFAINSAARPRL